MTKPKAPARLVGGPLDGKTFKAVSSWPSYLDAEGKRLHPGTGDRIRWRRKYRNGVLNACYFASERTGTGTVLAYTWIEVPEA